MLSDGFTLIESLISMGLLFIVLTAGMSFYFNSNEFLVMAMHKKIATELVNSELEELRGTAYSQIITKTELPVTVGGFDFTPTITAVLVDGDDPPDGINDYKEVTVKVAWTEAGGFSPSKDITMVTYIAP